jgi:hypothetical protein
MDTIRLIFAALLRLFTAPDRRADADRLAADRQVTGPVGRAPRITGGVLRAEDVALVRPYVVAFERRREAQRQRDRRRALWLALHGIDVGPRIIHRMRVAG